MMESASLQQTLLKDSQILVNIDEVCENMLVVSYEESGIKMFQGVLLDISKKNIPFGLSQLYSSKGSKDDNNEKYSALSQRHSYCQMSLRAQNLRVATALPSRIKTNSRMTVRLRPRRVLCSKCKSVCNENSENIDVSQGSTKKSSQSDENFQAQHISSDDKREDTVSGSQYESSRTVLALKQQSQINFNEKSSPNRNNGEPSIERIDIHSLDNQNAYVTQEKKVYLQRYKIENLEYEVQGLKSAKEDVLISKENSTDVPKVSGSYNLPKDSFLPSFRSQYDVVPSIKLVRGTVSRHGIVSNSSISEVDMGSIAQDCKILSQAENPQDTSVTGKKNVSYVKMNSKAKRSLRKKRSVGSMEDLWDESFFDSDKTQHLCCAKRSRNVEYNKSAILKNQSLVENNLGRMIKISFKNCPEGHGTVVKIPASQYQSYDTCIQSNKTKESIDNEVKTNVCDQYAKNSKYYYKETDEVSENILDFEANELMVKQKRHKHKVKHHKKHKANKKSSKKLNSEFYCDINCQLRKSVEEGSSSSNMSFDSYRAIKAECLKQKLSISLKRLNANAYAKCDELKKSETSMEQNDANEPGNWQDHSGGVVYEDFLNISSPSYLDESDVCESSLEEGDVKFKVFKESGNIQIGDIVWGETSIAWWPGKVRDIYWSHLHGIAKYLISFYGTSKLSYLPVGRLSPYLKTFKLHFSPGQKVMRGLYNKAVKLANIEARYVKTNSSVDL